MEFNKSNGKVGGAGQKRSSLINQGMMLGTLIMNSSQAVGGDSYSSGVAGSKEFFNQTAPINMKNINKLYPAPISSNNIEDFGGGSTLSNNNFFTSGPVFNPDPLTSS